MYMQFLKNCLGIKLLRYCRHIKSETKFIWHLTTFLQQLPSFMLALRLLWAPLKLGVRGEAEARWKKTWKNTCNGRKHMVHCKIAKHIGSLTMLLLHAFKGTSRSTHIKFLKLTIHNHHENCTFSYVKN